jgi:hypothetical protein
MPFWTLKATAQSPKCKWTTGEAYDIKGNDHHCLREIADFCETVTKDHRAS